MVIQEDIGTSPLNLSLLAVRPGRCIATDQAGKHQVIVTAATNQHGPYSTKGPGIRFVIMKASSLEERSSSYPRRRKKRPSKVPPRRQLDSLTPYCPLNQVGNPRKDCFDSFPVKNTRSVAMAIDYSKIIHSLEALLGSLIFSIVVTHMLPTHSTGSHQYEVPNLYLPILRMGMQHEDLFEAIVAFALAYMETHSYGRSRITPDIAYHNGRAIAVLRRKLTNPETCADDAAILTTMLLTDGAVMLLVAPQFVRSLI